MVSTSAIAQIKFETLPLKDLLAKAKAENKLVMVICSATMFDHCKEMEKRIYSTAEVGNAINPKFLTLFYNLDVTDPEGIAKKFGIMIYPTFLFFDSDGNEVSRILGTKIDPTYFIETVLESSAKKNWYDAREERYKNDPTYTIEHLIFLKSLRLDERVNKLTDSIFAQKNAKSHFTKKNMSLIPQLIKSLDSPIIKLIVENKNDISTMMGEKEYKSYLKDISITTIFNNGGFSDSKTIDKDLAFIKTNPDFESGMSLLVGAAKTAILNKDAIVIATEATKLMSKLSSKEKDMIAWYINICHNQEAPKTSLIKFYTEAMKGESDKEILEKLSQKLKEIQI